MKKIILILSLLILPFKISLAQVSLLPANVTFTIYSIELYPVSDYTGSTQFIGIFGDKTRLDILWSAKYNPSLLDPINVTCWLNCKNNTDVTYCYGLQNCSYQGPTGAAACTIFYPKYNYSTINNITCKFFNPNQPSLDFRLPNGAYPQRTFYPIKYSVSVAGGTYTIGSLISLPVSFVPYSLIKGNYSAFAYVLPEYSTYVYIDNSYNTTKDLEYLEIGTVYPKLLFVYSGGNFYLDINTTANQLTCNSDKDCPAIITEGYQNITCLQNKCFYIFELQVGSAYLSLPEYQFTDWLILLFASILIFLIFLKP